MKHFRQILEHLEVIGSGPSVTCTVLYRLTMPVKGFHEMSTLPAVNHIHMSEKDVQA